MKNNLLTLILAMWLLPSATVHAASQKGEWKPRLVVLTDIGDCNVEPDDMESAIRLLAYADRFEIEAIMTTTGWNCDPYPESWADYLQQVVDAYAKDVNNLMKRSSQKGFLPLIEENDRQQLGYWPSAEYVRSRTMSGSHRAGIGVVGEGNDSPGSDFLIRLADEADDRPIWVAAWGGANTLAQAIWRVKQTRSADELKAFLHKFRLYTITDQDMVYAMRMNRAYSSHMWMRREFKDDLKFVWDEGTWQLQCELGKQHWDKHQQYIQHHGALGAIYPDYKWGVEGDTPSFLYVMPNGLADPEDPTQAGGGGCHIYDLCADSLTFAWTSWRQPQKQITEGYKQRFYPDELNDFCARMQWAQGGRGNRNPIVRINGRHSVMPLHVKAKAGKSIVLDAGKSYDDEGQTLSFRWWHQPEAGNYHSEVHIDGADSPKMKLTIPPDARGKSIHIVCEVKDDGPFNLVSYMRIIIDA